MLRAYGPDDNSESPRVKSVYACLRDGLVVCFFIADDGTMTMQVTNPENQTIEITSMGIVRMFGSHLYAKANENEKPAGEKLICSSFLSFDYLILYLRDLILDLILNSYRTL